MGSRFQQQSLRRKIVYIVLIVALFTTTLFIRKWAGRYSIESQADQLALREQNLGDVDLTDRALRLSLTGSRGFAVCALWYAAIDRQMRHEWNEVELLVRSVIKLQPHFITPWLFQSWNLAYNVSVECDRVRDKYFYIARGVQLLAEGDRQNKNDPNIRFYVGMYTQNKIGISDEHNTTASLFQLSSIRPAERNPDRFRRIVNGTSQINWDELEDFCQKHPHLVRRLHDKLRCKTPDDLVDFLAANFHIPDRFEERRGAVDDTEGPSARLKSNEVERWPVLPPGNVRTDFDPNELNNDSELGDDVGCYAVGRSWFGYSQDPINVLRKHPRYMAQVIFQGYPARSQAYVAERREKEGWFDAEGWALRDWFPQDRGQPDGPRRTLTVGNDRPWAGEAWDRAFLMYKEYGERTGMLKRPEELRSMTSDERFRYEGDRSLSNYPHFYFTSDVERMPEAITARKNFFRAEQMHHAGDDDQAMEVFEQPEALATWKKLLLDHPEWRADWETQEEAYMLQWKYSRLLRSRREPALKQLLVMQDFLTQGAEAAPGPHLWVPIHLVKAVRVPFKLPFNDVDAEGQPILTRAAVQRAIQANELTPEPPVVPTSPSPSPPTGPAPRTTQAP